MGGREEGGGVLLNCHSVPLECRTRFKSARNVTKIFKLWKLFLGGIYFFSVDNQNLNVCRQNRRTTPPKCRDCETLVLHRVVLAWFISIVTFVAHKE